MLQVNEQSQASFLAPLGGGHVTAGTLDYEICLSACSKLRLDTCLLNITCARLFF